MVWEDPKNASGYLRRPNSRHSRLIALCCPWGFGAGGCPVRPFCSREGDAASALPGGPAGCGTADKFNPKAGSAATGVIAVTSPFSFVKLN